VGVWKGGTGFMLSGGLRSGLKEKTLEGPTTTKSATRNKEASGAYDRGGLGGSALT